jgi:predicted cobalt transporter CbtA
MEQRLILRGFGSGALGGLLAFVFARLLAEPVVQRAIDYESGRHAAEDALRRAAAAQDPELFSRGVQRNAGLPLGVILFGLAMGGLVAVAYVLVARGMRLRARPRTVALWIAAAGFAGFFLLPFVKYPADPPGVEHAETIRARGLLYLAMVAISVASVVAAALAARRLAPRLGGGKATLVGLLALAAWVAVVMAILPSVEPSQPLRAPSGRIVYPDFPRDLLFQFRLCAIGAQMILWTTVGLAYGALVERLTSGARRAADPAPRPERTADVLAH